MTVPADSIVETLNVIKYVRLCIVPRRADLTFDSFLLQAAEEGFSDCVVSEVTPTTHAGQQGVAHEGVIISNQGSGHDHRAVIWFVLFSEQLLLALRA